jgi:predicted DNA-binding transcriptional regulator AlpA
MMTVDEVLAIVPVSRSTLFRMERLKRFPRAHQIADRRKIWFADEVAAWQRNLIKSKVKVVA